MVIVIPVCHVHACSYDIVVNVYDTSALGCGLLIIKTAAIIEFSCYVCASDLLSPPLGADQ